MLPPFPMVLFVIFISKIIKIQHMGSLPTLCYKGWLAIAKLKPLSLFIALLLMLKKALDNVKMEK